MGKIKPLNKLLRFFVFLTTISTLSIPLFAEDELWLSGKVLTYDNKTGRIEIEVTTESCPGKRVFKTTPGLLRDALVGKEVHFGVDTIRCEPGKTYRITTNILEGVKP